MHTKSIPFALLLVILLGFLPSCGGAGKHENTLKASLISLNAARDGFVAWDREHQDQIVREAPTYVEGRQRLDDYRKDRERVVAGFEIAYRALAVAALKRDDISITLMLAEAKAVYDRIRDLTGKAPKGPDEAN